MKLPEYVPAEEVKRVCEELGFRDWSAMKDTSVTREESDAILAVVNVEKMPIDPEDFRQGLEVELEHGTMYPDANVTNNHPVITGKIVLAHLKETLDYYRRLDVAELEGDLLKAVKAGDLEKITRKYRKLVEAQKALARVVSDQL